jgi:hypothetical protein
VGAYKCFEIGVTHTMQEYCGDIPKLTTGKVETAAAMFYACIWEVLSLSLDQVTDYSE